MLKVLRYKTNEAVPSRAKYLYSAKEELGGDVLYHYFLVKCDAEGNPLANHEQQSRSGFWAANQSYAVGSATYTNIPSNLHWSITPTTTERIETRSTDGQEIFSGGTPTN